MHIYGYFAYNQYLIPELAVKLFSFLFFLAAYFCIIYKLSRYVWGCQQQVGSTGITQALRGIRFNAWKKPTECWGDLTLRRVSHIVIGLQVHPRCVSTHTKGIPVPGRNFFSWLLHCTRAEKSSGRWCGRRKQRKSRNRNGHVSSTWLLTGDWLL